MKGFILTVSQKSINEELESEVAVRDSR